MAGVERQRAPRKLGFWGLTSFDPSHPPLELGTTEVVIVAPARVAAPARRQWHLPGHLTLDRALGMSTGAPILRDR